MAIDEKQADQIRAALTDAASVREVKMFGGLGFMLNGNMVAASSHRGLLVRVGEKGVSAALARGAQPMIMNGRQMKDFVWITGTLDARRIKAWLRTARAFVETLPAKKPATGSKGKRKTP
jgi:TfoX/Sxy family transcriptional regulator of competence genes